MKVLHIGQMIGGLDAYIRDTIMYASGSIEYVIIRGAGDGNQPVYSNGKKVKEYTSSLQRELNFFKDIKAFFTVLSVIGIEKPDVIHCHSAKSGVIGRVAGFIKGIPTVYTPHGFSFLCSPSKVKCSVFLFIERISKLNAWLLACGESESLLGEKKVGYRPEKILHWHNAIPDTVKVASDIYPYISIVGRPSYQKNPQLVVEVLDAVHKQMPSLKICWMGVGYYCPELKKTQELIRRYGLEDTIELLPWISHDEVLSRVSSSVLFLTLSRYEGLSLSVLEAMSLGKPVVASKVVGNVDCVKDGINGVLLSVSDIQEIADAIVRLAADQKKCQEMGNNSRNLFLTDFNIENRIELLENIYRKLETVRN